jgi:hypothetical protein
MMRIMVSKGRDKMAGLRMGLLSFLLAGMVAGQTQKERTDTFFRERGQLQQRAQAAFDAEMAREKGGDCPNAGNTVEINACLAGEVAKTTGNYNAYAGSLRSMLAQKNPFGGASVAAAGPTGKPLSQADQLRDFDQTEAGWGKYRDTMCAGAYGLYKGGTIVNAIADGCQLILLRSHMRELKAVYGEYFSH